MALAGLTFLRKIIETKIAENVPLIILRFLVVIFLLIAVCLNFQVPFQMK